MGTVPTWAAVVVNYESGALLAGCVEALLADDSAGSAEVVVVDNASTDGSVARLQAVSPAVSVLRPHANLGYARAANLGIAATRAPLVAVLNPDTVLAPGSAGVVAAAFGADPALAAVGPRILNPDGTVYPSARAAPGVRDAVGHALLGRVRPDNRWTRAYLESGADPSVARDVAWVSGAMVWFRRGWLDRVGGWDERFFLFLEDVDVCRSVGEAGGRVRYEPGAVVTHLVGASRSTHPVRSVVAHHRSAYAYAAKWWRGPRRALLPGAAAFLTLRAGSEILAGSIAGRGRPESSPVTG
jgi:N-acetylglucosaminyl-diphospho-decaprenol L-rhamnosyltransferase